MLLIGNSFFRPYADHLDNLTTEANLFEHNSTVVFRGGENGRPINLWNDSITEEHQLIKSTLDQGNIEVFGMTSGYDIDSDNPTEGHSAWINYALQNNPNIFIGKQGISWSNANFVNSLNDLIVSNKMSCESKYS